MRSVPLVCVIIILLGAVAGCLGAENDQGPIKEDILAATDAIETFTVEIEITQSSGGELFFGEWSAVVDLLEREYHANTSSSWNGHTMETETLLVNDTRYTNRFGQWSVDENASMDPPSLWEVILEQQRSFIEVGEINHQGADHIAGVDVEVIQVNVTDEDVKLLLKEYNDPIDYTRVADPPPELTVSSFSLTQFIGSDDHLIHKVAYRYIITIEHGFASYEIQRSVSIWFTDFDEEVVIEPPEEALSDEASRR